MSVGPISQYWDSIKLEERSAHKVAIALLIIGAISFLLWYIQRTSGTPLIPAQIRGYPPWFYAVVISWLVVIAYLIFLALTKKMRG
jgi:uncharacterized membrane protein YozB (DUF420 family)